MLALQLGNSSLCLPQKSTTIFSEDSKFVGVVSTVTRGPGDKPPKNNSSHYQSLASQHTRIDFREVAIGAASHHAGFNEDLHSVCLERRLSDRKLVTNNFCGDYNEQDNFLPVTKQLQHTKRYSKTNDNFSLNTNNDSIEMSTVSFGVEESEPGSKALYVIVIGNRVKTVNTKLYASLPIQSKFMVKERQQNSKVKLLLKSSHERFVTHAL